jgi:hypothetical protein
MANAALWRSLITTAREVRAPLCGPQEQDKRHDFGREGHTHDVEELSRALPLMLPWQHPVALYVIGG